MPDIQKISERGRITLPEELWKGQGNDLSVSVSQITDETVLVRRVKEVAAPLAHTKESLVSNCIAAAVLCDRCTAALQTIIDDLLLQQAKKTKDNED